MANTTDALIKVTLTAICGSDIHIKRGNIPMIEPGIVMGHECCGIVEDVGSDVGFFKKGDRVVSSAAYACGKCFYLYLFFSTVSRILFRPDLKLSLFLSTSVHRYLRFPSGSADCFPPFM